MDINKSEIHPPVFTNERISVLIGDSAASEMVDQVFSLLPEERGKVLFILDSDHRASHVKKELDVYVPLMRTGDYLIVEDTLLNHEDKIGIYDGIGDGPREAIDQFVEENPDILLRDFTRENKYGATVAPYGYYTKV